MRLPTIIGVSLTILCAACSTTLAETNQVPIPLLYEAGQTNSNLSESAVQPSSAIDAIMQLYKQAQTYNDQGNYAEAKKMFEICLEKSRAKFGADDPITAFFLDGLGGTSEHQGDYEHALSYYEHSLKIRETALGPEHLQVTYSLFGLASVHRELGDSSEALALLRRTQGISEKNFPLEEPMVTIIENSLAMAYLDQGEESRGIDLLKRSLAIHEKFLKPDHPESLHSLDNLATFYGLCFDWEAAAKSFQQSLLIKERAYGTNSLTVADSLWGLANCYRRLGKATNSLPLFERALSIKQATFGNNRPEVASALSDLASAYQESGDYARALDLYQQALLIRERLFGPAHISVAFALGGLADVYRAQGNYARALVLSQRRLEITEKLYGNTHPNLTSCLWDITLSYMALGNYEKAVEFSQRALSINERAYGKNHHRTIHSQDFLGLVYLEQGDFESSIKCFFTMFKAGRNFLASAYSHATDKEAMESTERQFFAVETFHTLCEANIGTNTTLAWNLGAEQLAFDKALLEEVRAIRSLIECDPRTSSQELGEQYSAVQAKLERLLETKLDTAQRDMKRRELQGELSQLEEKLAARVDLVAQTVRERNLTLTDVARNISPGGVLVDFIQYRRYDFIAKTNQWKAQRYAAYLTFPLSKDSTNVVVERVDLGEAAPINDAVELVCKRMSAGQFAARDLSPALQRLSDLVYAPLARHLTNVSHLIVCPDGQLSRLPFEMLPVGNNFLIEEKTISYVTSGREVVRLQSRAGVSPAQTGEKSPAAPDRRDALSYVNGKSLVMGNPDFDLDLNVAQASQPALQLVGKMPALLSSAATRSLSRSYRGMTFTALPGSGVEATNVAKLLGSDAVLRLGPEAREAELKAVVSPRVLHLATHGFFLSDQEFKHTNSGRADLLAGLDARQRVPTTKNDWENPLVRCGIALAGANHALQITNAIAEDGLLTGLEASLLNLQGTELVILSACDSGTGEVKIGEGVMSLRRAFRIAGAESVLASHWPVNDKATSRLMTEFMRRWRAGEPRAQAWREAQLELLRSKDFSNPYFWSAFTLTGQWN